MKSNKRQEEAMERLALLEASIKEKDVMIRELTVQNEQLVTELHHRFKNNLQIVNSLINSQIQYNTELVAREELLVLARRFYALSLAHQKLFQTRVAASIEFSAYLIELSDYLADEFEMRDRIKFTFDTVPLSLDISIAIPLGFIANEILSLFLKHSFESGQTAHIQIGLFHKDKIGYSLTISIDDSNFLGDTNLLSDGSYRSTLIQGLTNQIKGVLTVDNENQIMLNFNAEGYQQSSKNTIT